MRNDPAGARLQQIQRCSWLPITTQLQRGVGPLNFLTAENLHQVACVLQAPTLISSVIIRIAEGMLQQVPFMPPMHAHSHHTRGLVQWLPKRLLGIIHRALSTLHAPQGGGFLVLWTSVIDFTERAVRRAQPYPRLRQQRYHPTAPFGCVAGTEGTSPLWERFI